MAKLEVVACRYYTEPLVWCQYCRAGRPEKCLEPTVRPRGAPRFPQADVEPFVAEATPLGLTARDWAAGLWHSVGCALIGGGTAVLLEGHMPLGVSLLCSGLTAGGLALATAEH